MKPVRRSLVLYFVVFVLTFAAMWVFWFAGKETPIKEPTLYDDTLNQDSSLAIDELGPENYAVNVPEIEQQEVIVAVEAETVDYSKPVHLEDVIPNYRGIGYLTGLPADTQNALVIPISVPATQHYDLTICMAADQQVENILSINGQRLHHFRLDGTRKFMRVTFYGIFLEEGKSTVALETLDGGLSIDYLELVNHTTIYTDTFQIADTLVNPNASEEASALYQILCNQWGKQMLTGQYVSSPENRELKLIQDITGQLPAIRFSELGQGNDLAQIEAATDWHLYMNGIVGLMWQWNAPGTDSVYAEDVDFDLAAALDSVDVTALAQMPLADAKSAVADGTLPEGALALLQDIDAVSESLIKLRNMKIPLLWRPLHEASGGWYWWGASGAYAYQQLWALLYHRMTDYHNLNHLIWIWNGQSIAYLVSDDTYDIASVDIYLNSDIEFGSRYEQFLALANMTGRKKLLALSECSSPPNLEMLALDDAVWSFYGLWYGEYIMDSDGKFTNSYYSSSDLYNLYNSDRSMSLKDFLVYQQNTLENPE